jgi:hypothetical protein
VTVQRIWPATNGPDTSGADSQPVNVATEFNVSVQAWATSLWFYRGTTAAQPDNLRLYRVDTATTGTVLAEVAAPVLGATLGWREFPITPVELTPGQAYRVAGHFAEDFTATAGYWTGGGPGAAGITNGFLTAPNDATATASDQGSFNYDAAPRMPDNSFGGGNYWMDVTVTDVDPTAESPSGPGLSVVALATTVDGAKQVADGLTSTLGLGAAVDGAKTASGGTTSPLTLGGAVDGHAVHASAEASTLTLASTSTGAPVTGPIPAVVSPVLCSPWATMADVPAAVQAELGLTVDQWAPLLMRASELLWMLSGRVWYGAGCTEDATLRSLPNPAPGGPGGLWAWHESWGACACWNSVAGFAQHIGAPTRVKLPRSPVQAVTSVTVGGVVLPADQYRLNHAGVLERIGGTWDVCSGATVVTYTYGEAPPAGGRDSAVVLATELARDQYGIGECRLPSNVTSVTRQEVTITMADPTDLFDKGRTGLASVDLWLNAVNGLGRRQRARVFSPDLPRTNRRNLT